MATLFAQTEPVSNFNPLSSSDKYRGAVVEVSVWIGFEAVDHKWRLGSSIASCILPSTERTSIPCYYSRLRSRLLSHTVRPFSSLDHGFKRHHKFCFSVLDRTRRPVGYLDVTKLKEQWNRGTVDPVRTRRPSPARRIRILVQFRTRRFLDT
jgi:hypothetical protein